LQLFTKHLAEHCLWWSRMNRWFTNIVKCTGRARKWPLWAGYDYTKVTVTTGLTVHCTCCRLDLKQANLTTVWLLSLLVSDLTYTTCTKHLLYLDVLVCGHHLLVISSVKPLYNGKFIFKIIPEVISKVRYFSQMYKKSRGVTKYIA
jgi:hypothetical protein